MKTLAIVWLSIVGVSLITALAYAVHTVPQLGYALGSAPGVLTIVFVTIWATEEVTK
jgi:hypothetical protein